jgi:PAS domain S-box-containing protein
MHAGCDGALLKAPPQEPRFPRWLTIAVIVVALGIAAGGWLFYTDQNHAARHNVEDDLLAIGHLKAEQIANWRAERLADAGLIVGDPSSNTLITRWLALRQSADAAEIVVWFRTLKEQYHYANVQVVDAGGVVLIDLSAAGKPLARGGYEGLQTALAEKKAVLTDLHFDADGETVHLDAIAPFFSGQGSSAKFLGAVILTANASDFLFPLIQTWPTASRSAETLLVRRDGDQALYLNELRYQKDTALKLKVPLTQKNVPAVQAVLGASGIVEGADYRGVMVTAAVQRIPDSPWFIVAKIDRAEALGGARLRSIVVVVLTVLLLAALIGGVGLAWQRGLKKHYLEAYNAELSRQALLARYEILLKQANDAILLSNEDLRIVEANERAVETYGYSLEEFLNLRMTDLAPPDEMAAFQARMKELKETDSFLREATHRRKDGSVLTVEVSSRVVSVDGKTYFQAIIRDISERKRAEDALRASRERYQAVAKATAQIIWITDAGGDLVDDLPTLRAYTGLSNEELRAGGWQESVHPEDRAQASEAWDRALGAKSLYEVEYRLRRADGVYRDFWVRSIPVFDRNGQVREWVGACADVTERKRAEEERLQLERQFQQSQRLESLGVLAGGIAHDFNNILMAVLGYADLALTDLPIGSAAREDVKEIARASKRAAELCRQMLAYSGRGHFVVEAIDLPALIDTMIHLLSSAISKKILLNLNLEKNLPPILGDASQVDQVIMNLVINASEAIGERSGVITISTGAMECTRSYMRETYLDEGLAEGLYVILEVSDTGAGMDKEAQSHLFEPFFSTKFTGRGLGLAAVLGIVRGHKGAIKVYSEEGKGTTFKLLFPAAESERPSGKRENGVDLAWRGSGTILLVDDEETIRVLGRRMLERLGFEVLVASDGREALDVYRQHRAEIEVVLLDLTMPHMNGEEAFRELRRMDPQLRVLMSSGYTENDTAARFAGKGLAGFIQKPYTLELLSESLRAVVNGTGPSDPSRGLGGE